MTRTATTEILAQTSRSVKGFRSASETGVRCVTNRVSLRGSTWEGCVQTLPIRRGAFRPAPTRPTTADGPSAVVAHARGDDVQTADENPIEPRDVARAEAFLKRDPSRRARPAGGGSRARPRGSSCRPRGSPARAGRDTCRSPGEAGGGAGRRRAARRGRPAREPSPAGGNSTSRALRQPLSTPGCNGMRRQCVIGRAARKPLPNS